MANTIKHKQSAVAAKVPTTTQLQLGELGINTYDGKLYLKKNVSGTETIVDVSGSVTGVSGTAPIVSSGGTTPAISITAATTSAAGSMSAADKAKLDGVATGATANTGTVTSASIVSANGFAGTVATGSTTPAITLSTSVTGLLKGNGTAISAAVSGTDYQAPVTGGATTITTSNLTASRALLSDASGKVAVSGATSTELGYLSGVTSAIQTQLNSKASTATANTFTDAQVISANSSSSALRITQIGSGNALVVEDSANPDSTPFVIDGTGRVGVGGTPSVGKTLLITQDLTGGTTAYGIDSRQIIQSDVLQTAYVFASNPSTAAAPFNMNGALYHYYAAVPSLGAGSIIASQFGYYAGSLTAGTNNYGFFTNMTAVGSGGSATSTVSSISSAGNNVTITTTATHGLSANQTVTVSLTANATALVSGVPCTILTVGTTDFTLIGASSNTIGVSFVATGAGLGTGTVRLNQQNSSINITTIVNSTQFTYISPASATFATITASGTVTPNTRYNFYAAGTAPNYLAGDLRLGNNLALGTTDNASLISISSGLTSTRFQGVALWSGVSGTVPYVYGYRFTSNASAGATITAVYGFRADQGTLSSTPQNQYGFHADSSLTGATNNYGFYSNIPSSAGDWNFYAAGTADNYFEGPVKTNGTLAGGYLAHAAGTTAMALGADKVVKVTPNATTTYTTTVAPAGATAKIIIVTSGTTAYTITFGTGFLTTGTLSTGTVSAKTFVISFVSDGTTMIESSRTVAM